MYVCMYVCMSVLPAAYQSGYVRVAEQLQRGHFSQAAVQVAQLGDLVRVADLDCELRPLTLARTLAAGGVAGIGIGIVPVSKYTLENSLLSNQIK